MVEALPSIDRNIIRNHPLELVDLLVRVAHFGKESGPILVVARPAKSLVLYMGGGPHTKI
jgi:hypothetical protein